MTTALVMLVIVVGAALCAVALLLLLQSGASLLRPRRLGAVPGGARYAILIPAHNETLVIEETVQRALALMGPTGRILVVADNCTDDTAAKARAAGAEVAERCAPLLRAKGYALAFGIDHLRQDPPEVVVTMDADCRCTRGTFELLARQALFSGKPVQALYLMSAAPGAALRIRIAAFAWAFKNAVRARGFARMGLPCQLTGSGMAFPWRLVDQVSFASASIVEDLQLGLRLAAAGHAPLLAGEVHVESEFPVSEAGERSQRRRWEHGHLETIARLGLPLALAGLRQANGALLALVADLVVPPLALFILALAGYAALAVVLAGSGVSQGPLYLAAAASGATGVAVLAGWWQVGRRWIGLAELASAPLYIVRKIPLYLGFIKGRQTAWTRTDRTP